MTIGHTTVMAETFFFKENKNLEDLGNSLESISLSEGKHHF